MQFVAPHLVMQRAQCCQNQKRCREGAGKSPFSRCEGKAFKAAATAR
jgi:hypothetical protein